MGNARHTRRAYGASSLFARPRRLSASARPRVPAQMTRAPLSRSSSATASAGTTCPAVPPAAITTVGIFLPLVIDETELRLGGGTLCDIDQDSHSREQHDQIAVPVG